MSGPIVVLGKGLQSIELTPYSERVNAGFCYERNRTIFNHVQRVGLKMDLLLESEQLQRLVQFLESEGYIRCGVL